MRYLKYISFSLESTFNFRILFRANSWLFQSYNHWWTVQFNKFNEVTTCKWVEMFSLEASNLPINLAASRICDVIIDDLKLWFTLVWAVFIGVGPVAAIEAVAGHGQAIFLREKDDKIFKKNDNVVFSFLLVRGPLAEKFLSRNLWYRKIRLKTPCKPQTWIWQVAYVVVTLVADSSKNRHNLN